MARKLELSVLKTPERRRSDSSVSFLPPIPPPQHRGCSDSEDTSSSQTPLHGETSASGKEQPAPTQPSSAQGFQSSQSYLRVLSPVCSFYPFSLCVLFALFLAERVQASYLGSVSYARTSWISYSASAAAHRLGETVTPQWTRRWGGCVADQSRWLWTRAFSV